MKNKVYFIYLLAASLCIGCDNSDTDTQVQSTIDQELVPLDAFAELEINGFTVSTTETFDSLGVLSSQLEYTIDTVDSIMSQFELDEAGVMTERARFHYGDNGLLILGELFSSTGDSVQTQQYERNADGRLQSIENQTPAGIETIAYSYDNGLITTRTSSFEDDDDPIVAEFSYNQDGNLISLVEDDIFNELRDTSTFAYNEEGKRIEKRVDLGTDGILDTVEMYSYDEFGNVVEISLFDDFAGLISREVLTYDAADRSRVNIVNFSFLYFP